MNRARLPLRAPAALLAVLAACDVSNPVSGPNLELPDQIGTAMAGSEGIQIGASMVWSADGSEVYFEGSDGTVRAVSPTGQPRTVDTARQRTDLSAAGDGSVYFVAERQGSSASAFRALNGQTRRLTDRLPNSTAIGRADGSLILSSPDDAFVAYIAAPDSLYLFEPATGDHTFIVSGCVRVVDFSPSGDELLCRRAGSRDDGFARVDLNARTFAVMTLLPTQGTLRQPHWDEVAIRALYTLNGRFRVRDAESGEITLLWAPLLTNGPTTVDFLHYAWSADGSRFAFWIHECLTLGRVGNCERGQSILYALDMATNTATRIAVLKGERGGEQLALTPDGRAIAYAFNGRIYYQPIS